MKQHLENLSKSLRTGFIDHREISLAQYRPQLLVNDKVAKKKVLSTILNELNKCNEFWISAAFATTSGVITLMNSLIDLAERKIPGKILVSQYLNFTQPEALAKLLSFQNLELRISTEGNFHSKGYFFRQGDIFDIIIGSSNLTANALCINKEWNLKVSANKESELVYQSTQEFEREFNVATKVDLPWIHNYNTIYTSQKYYSLDRIVEIDSPLILTIKPNPIQEEALKNLKDLREKGIKKALVVSATGTGKTYLSAFDVKEFSPRKFLFIVHRQNIAQKAMETFKRLLPNISSSLYSGSSKDSESDYIFATIQTISKEEHLTKFSKTHFDYIVIDETHRADASTYKKIMDYFEPKFLLGMTATPERTDGGDIFKLFDYNIAYEIRLQQALEKEMVAPFHYFGVTELIIEGNTIEDNSDFNLLTANERVDRIIEKSRLYGTDDGIIRGLVFCSKVDEAEILSKKFNEKGLNTIALTGSDSEEIRAESIQKLESDNKSEKLDYIFTVDIFNEGVDIPRVNQIIMLRPTQSAIVFVQQLGRGLRKIPNKEYLTVIDFIGNYSNNYMIPIALFGDSSYNKDKLRKLLSMGSELIPGSSSINFDEISMKRIFESINDANLLSKKDLISDYKLLKFKIGHIPFMCDFIDHGSRDPYSYVQKFNSYYNFLTECEADYTERIEPGDQKILLEKISQEINNAVRIEETILLEMILKYDSVTFDSFKNKIKADYGYEITLETILSCWNNLNLKFITEKKDNKLLPISQIYGLKIISMSDDTFEFAPEFKLHMINETFKKHLLDSILSAKKIYNSSFDYSEFLLGFRLYQKYSRKDVFRILNWEMNPVAQNVGGYIISKDKKNCPIFVTYHKDEGIANATKYEDIFLDNQTLQWMSKNNRTLASPDISVLKNHREHLLRIPLFVKKDNDEGQEFYYLGDVRPIEGSFEQAKIDGKNVVKLIFHLSHPVEGGLFEYLNQK